MTDAVPATASEAGRPAAGPEKRLLWTSVLALLLAALALWGSSALVWVEVPAGRMVGGRLGGDLTGSDLISWPVPLALFALAAVLALLALKGVARRVLGALLSVVGVWVLILTLGGGAYEIAWSGWAPGYLPQGQPTRTVWGPAAAIAGAAAMFTAGAMVVWRGHRMPRMGAKYSAPGAAGSREGERDPGTELWNSLTEGDDPTTREG